MARVELRGRPHLSGQILDGPRALTRNLPLEDAAAALTAVLEPAPDSAHLATTAADWQWQRPAKGAPGRLHRAPPSHTAVPAARHDRTPQHLLDPARQPWLTPLGLATPDGKLRASAQDKWRQVNRYVEHVAALLRDLPEDRRPGPDRPWRVVDLACGKGYLTFALHALLVQVHGAPAATLGVERRPEPLPATPTHAPPAGLPPTAPTRSATPPDCASSPVTSIPPVSQAIAPTSSPPSTPVTPQPTTPSPRA